MVLKRSIGTTGLLFAAVGGVIGSGWLFGPYIAARFAGPSAILSWVIGGVLMLFIALTFAELSSTFPLAGGSARFLKISHGPLVGFSMAWMAWISSIAVAPVETLALLRYATIYLPWLMHQSGHTYVLTPAGILVAAGIMLTLCVINSVGVKPLSKTNNFVVIFKLVIPIATAIILLSMNFHPRNFVSHGFAIAGAKGILSALPSAGVIFSFLGFGPAIQLAGEAKNPQRSVPIALIGALLICICLYVLLQFSFIAALNPQDFQHGWHALNFKHDAGPFAGLAVAVGAIWWAKVLYADAVISPFGTALIYSAATTRVCYALCEAGYLPGSLKQLNRFGIPTRIVLLNFLIGLLLFLPFPTWQNMMSFLVSALVFAYAVGPLSLVVLRKTLPDHHRPFRLPAPRWMCLLAFYICNMIVFWTGWQIVSKMLIAVAFGYLVLMLVSMKKSSREINWQIAKSWWIFFYIAILGMITYLGTFGGGCCIIPFGWDFLVIAGFSWLIYELSIRCALESDEASRHL